MHLSERMCSVQGVCSPGSIRRFAESTRDRSALPFRVVRHASARKLILLPLVDIFATFVLFELSEHTIYVSLEI